jgi:predicted molibdopterin-dependent oxidoreductase YjgC
VLNRDSSTKLAIARADEVAKALHRIKNQYGEKGGSVEVKGERKPNEAAFELDTFGRMIVHMSNNWV